MVEQSGGKARLQREVLAACARAVVKKGEVERCEFCGETEGLASCQWPALELIRSIYGRLVLGDYVKRVNDKRADRRPAYVTDLITFLDADNPKLNRVTVEVLISGGKVGRFKRFNVYTRSPVLVLREGRCGAVCCELHRCERGPSAVCCMEHWGAWVESPVSMEATA